MLKGLVTVVFTVLLVVIVLPADCRAIGYVVSSGQELNMKPGESSRMPLTLNNPTGDVLVLSIELSGTMAAYAILNRTTVTLPGGGSTSVLMSVSIPSNAGTSADLITIRLIDVTHGGVVCDRTVVLVKVHPSASAPTYMDQKLGPLSRNMWIYTSISILVLCEVVGFVLWLYLRKQRYRDFRVRDVFLIHRDGRLIKHISTQSATFLDHYSVSGMLTAIENFIAETFPEGDKSSRTGELVRDDVKILVHNGRWVYLAVVTNGNVPPRMRIEMTHAMYRLEHLYKEQLMEWDGSQEGLLNISVVLRPLIMLRGMTRGEEFFFGRLSRARNTLLGHPSGRITPQKRRLVKETARRYVSEGVFSQSGMDELQQFLLGLDDEEMESFDALMENVRARIDEERGEVVLTDPALELGAELA